MENNLIIENKHKVFWSSVCICMVLLKHGDFTGWQRQPLLSDREHILNVHGDNSTQLQTLQTTYMLINHSFILVHCSRGVEYVLPVPAVSV